MDKRSSMHFRGSESGEEVERGVRAPQPEANMHPDVKEVLFSKEKIAQRVSQIGEALSRDFAHNLAHKDDVLVVSILRGSAIFACDLVRAMNIPLELDFMVVSSYGSAAKSSGDVKIVKDLSADIQGKHVIIAEDVLDTGLTLSKLLPILEARNPASIDVVACFRKDVAGQIPIECRHIGFECPDEFLVGYGLDYAERYRNLPYVGVLKPEVYS